MEVEWTSAVVYFLNSIFNEEAPISHPFQCTRTQHKARFSPPFRQSAPSFSSKQVAQCGWGAAADWLAPDFQQHTPFLTTCADTSFAGRDWAGLGNTAENNLVFDIKVKQKRREHIHTHMWQIRQQRNDERKRVCVGQTVLIKKNNVIPPLMRWRLTQLKSYLYEQKWLYMHLNVRQ